MRLSRLDANVSLSVCEGCFDRAPGIGRRNPARRSRRRNTPHPGSPAARIHRCYNGARLRGPLVRPFCLTLLALAGALALTGASSAAPPQSQFAALTNYTQAQRPESAIRFVVIHVTEGSFLGTVSWLRDPRAHASANFVVGRHGAVQQLVPLHDVAWQAGNWAYNLRSAGIENVG